MNWYLVGGVILFIFIVGSVIALLWWNLAARIAPYEDERGKQSTKRKRVTKEPKDDGVVVTWSDASGSTDTKRRHADDRPPG